MEWKKLLSDKKLYDEPPEDKRLDDYPISVFERDYNKIVSSAAFRRLQDKTQVFPLDISDFVRTRLTHSIEVSTIARQLGIMATSEKSEYTHDDIRDYKNDIPSVLLCAGLLHDLGNPPFGHFGETVIGRWFQTNLDRIEYKKRPLRTWLSEQMARDLECFEGNAQTLRILLKAKYNSEINLSFAVINALAKYPTDSLSASKKDFNIKNHKSGLFFSEQKIFREIANTTGAVQESGELVRHPLTFLLEAADDIAYATADLEDAFKKNLFTLDTFIQFWKTGYNEQLAGQKGKSDAMPHFIAQQSILRLKKLRDELSDDNKALNTWLNETRRWLMYTTIYSFNHSYKNIMNGTYGTELFYDNFQTCTLKLLKKAMVEFAFNSSGILKLELSAETILSFLLDHFVRAVLYFENEDSENGYVPSTADRKYLTLLSSNYKNDYRLMRDNSADEGYNLYLRLLMVTDYVSGMTDTYARTLYRELSGIT